MLRMWQHSPLMNRNWYLAALLLVLAAVAAIALKQSKAPDVTEPDDVRQWFKGNTHA